MAIGAGLLPAFWKITDQLPVDVTVGDSVARGNQLPMQLRDVVAARFPPLCNHLEVRIEPGPALGRFLFGKGAIAQPARDSRVAYSQPPQQWPFARSLACASPQLAGIGPVALLASPDSAVRVWESFSAALCPAQEKAKSLLTPNRSAFDEWRDGAREPLQQTYSGWPGDGTGRRTGLLGEPLSEPQKHSLLHDPGSPAGFLDGISSKRQRFRLFYLAEYQESDDFADRPKACRRYVHA